MPIDERLMAAGAWSFQLKQSTPVSIRRKLDPSVGGFGLMVFTPTRVDPNAYSAGDLRRLASYVGVFRRNDGGFNPSGASPLVLIGDEHDKGEKLAGGSVYSTRTLDAWLSGLLPTNGVVKGTVTNTGTDWTSSLPVYVSRRAALEAACAGTGAEFRITVNSSGNIAVDAATQATLYGSTPVGMVIKRDGGREGGIIGLRATEMGASSDVEDATSTVWWVGRADGGAQIGSATSALPFYAPGGASTIKMERLIDSSSTFAADVTTMATLELGKYGSIRREFNIRVDPTDIVGFTQAASGATTTAVRCGDQVYVYDPEMNIMDTANQVIYRGETVYPLKLRVFGINWPVRGGVYFITPDASPTVIDLTDYYVPEDGDVTLTVGAQNRPLLGGTSLSTNPFGDVPATVAYDGWTAYTPTWSSTGTQPAIGNGTLIGAYQRIGRTIYLRIRLVPGTTTTFGTGVYFISVPFTSGAGDGQLLTALLFDTSGASFYAHTGYLPTGSSSVQFPRGNGTTDQFGPTIPVTLATGDVFNVSGAYEAATS